MPTPPANALSSTFQVGTYTSLTDTFTSVFDLNDGVTTTIMWNTMKMPQPEKVFVRSFNLRAPGERVTRFQYKNRHIQVSVSLRGATVQAILNTCHSLIAAIENPTYRLRIAQPNATQYTYATVVAVTHNIPADPQTLLAKALTNVQIDFECLPALLGDRVTLQNLVVNPGFEAPSGPGVVAFIDNFANVNAYTVAAGSVPTVAAGVMTIPASTRLQFGSPAWGAINSWQMRVQTPAAGGWDFQPGLHINGTSSIFGNFFSTGIELHQNSNGTDHLLGSTAFGALANSTWYWLTFSQFPAAPGPSFGSTPLIQFSVNADSAGTIGALIATVAPVATFDNVSALTGRMQLNAVTGAWNVSSNVVQLFGPGGWTTAQNGGTGLVSFAWEQNTSNTYPNGPAMSNGAARIDFAPAGTISAYWTGFNSGTVGGTSAIPASAGQTLGVSAQAKTSGVGVGFQAILYLSEYNSGGSFLRQTQIQALTGVQPWMTLSGTVTTGANCAFVSVWLLAFDNSAGSVNGTIWFDNVQCWNQTTTGQTSMPYCELRFQQSPAQLLVSGILGDMPAPCSAAIGAYVTSSTGNGPGTYTMALGRRNTVTSPWQLAGKGYGTGVPTLNSGSWGGYYMLCAATSAQTENEVLDNSYTALAPMIGTYYQLFRLRTKQTANLSKFGSQGSFLEYMPDGAGTNNSVYITTGPLLTGQISTTNTWTILSPGQVTMPPLSYGAQQDLTHMQAINYFNWNDPNSGGNLEVDADWWAWIPVDGSLVTATAYLNTGTMSGPFWLWHYIDGLQAAYAPSTVATLAWNYGAAIPGAAGTGSALSQASNYLPYTPGAGAGSLTATLLADPYLTLDPTQTLTTGGTTLSVNEIAGVIYDNGVLGNVLPVHVELQYAPLYLYPR